MASDILYDVHLNMNSLCRICLEEVKVKDAINLFPEDKDNEIIQTIVLCFQITLYYKKYLPSLICNVCASELHIANTFRLKCITSEERLANNYNQSQENTQNPSNIVVKTAIQRSLCYEDLIDPYDAVTDYHIESDFDPVKNSDEFSKDSFSKLKKSLKSKEFTDNENPNNFLCAICNRNFKRKKSLLKHHVSMHENRTHVGKVTGHGATRRYHCTKCKYSTPYSQTLVTHVRRHTGEKPYRCDCGKCFTDLSTFNAHTRIHSATTYFTCSTCGKQFKIAKALKQHLRSHENGKFPCNVCHKILKSRQTLQDHTRRHYNIRNFNCEDCGDTFVTSSELIHHKVKHKLDKHLECHLCGYKTLRRRNLIIHLKRHANDRPYKCEVCDASFYSKAEVRRHQTVHTRDKAFQCSTCPKGFSRKTALNKHMESSHHSDNKWSDSKITETVKVKLEKSNDRRPQIASGMSSNDTNV